MHPRDVTLDRVHVMAERGQISAMGRIDGTIVIVAARVAKEVREDVEREERADRDEKLHLDLRS
jgi:hypothetical protein